MDGSSARLVGAVAVVALLGLGAWWLLPAGEGPRASGPSTPGERVVTTFTPTPAGSSAEGAPSEPSEAEPPAVPAQERPSPRTPEEEGLYALADASGKATVRCPLSKPLSDDALDLLDASVVVGDEIVLPVEPNDAPDEERLGAWTDGETQLVARWRNAFPGTLGSCTLTVREPDPSSAAPAPEPIVKVVLDDASLKEALGRALEANEQVLADQEEAMDPVQVALDQPGLSDGARAWLTARLEDETARATETVETLGGMDLPAPHAPE